MLKRTLYTLFIHREQSELATTPKAKENSDSTSHISTNIISNITSGNSGCGGGSSNSNSSNNGGCNTGPAVFNYNIVFVFQDSKKHTGAVRRRHEALVSLQMEKSENTRNRDATVQSLAGIPAF